ncbi:hypothetical protein E4U43_004232 [Claviceps pusilla]|uniref:NAD(P)-binding protein n=1 Tax=Claviceps pusilla TaxID=123648 RepID=A0A9P7SX11_9HYPO|nr:hypothetical protein E4U43_004232 [Claviceps pusilla]
MAPLDDPFNPYKDLYAHPAGPGDARPTARQVLADCTTLGSSSTTNPWIGRVILVTGGTAGVGLETAAAVKARILEEDDGSGSSSRGKLEFLEMNLESLDSVRAGTREFLSRSGRLNVLINNAGIIHGVYTRTEDGFESHFGVNHLAHYLLTRLVLPALEASSSPQFQSRVINLSSTGHNQSSVRLDDYNLEGSTKDQDGDQDGDKAARPPPFDYWVAYGQSKTALIWTANHIDRVYGPRGVHALSVHPGIILTNLASFLSEEERRALEANEKTRAHRATAEQGAATTVWAAAGDVWEGKGGKYLLHCSVAEVGGDDDGFPLSLAAGEYAYDPEGEEKLWKLSAKLVGVEE